MATKMRTPVEDYLALPMSDQLEYIRGEVLEKPMGNADHGVLASFVIKCFLDYIARFGGRSGIEGRSRFPDSQDPRYMLPDLSLYRRGMRFREGLMFLPPTITAEVRSPDQTMANQRERCRYYIVHGVEEAWLIDPVGHVFEVFDSGRDAAVLTGGVFASSALNGLELNLDEMFAQLDTEEA